MSAQALDTAGEPPAEEDLQLLQEFMQEQEEQQENAEFHEPYEVEEPEPPAQVLRLSAISAVLDRTLPQNSETRATPCDCGPYGA